MSNLTFPCLDPSSPAPPLSPMQPICTSLFSRRPCTSLFSRRPSNPFSSSRFRKKIKSIVSETKRLEMTDDGLEKFYQTYGVDGRRIHEFPGNPYSQGLAAWRIQWEKKRVTTMMKKRESSCWTEKYRPRAMDEFICHRDIALGLRQQVARGVDSHFIFEGPPGVGKKTMVRAFLREAFGPGTLQTREELKEFELKGEEKKAKIELHVTSSPQHVEIDLSKIEGYEKHVITALVEETHTMATKAIVLFQADQLCMDTQDYICWIMEKHKNCHKFLFCCSDLSNLQSIRAMCAMIQLLPPSNDEIFSVLEHIAEKEGIEMPQDVALTIAKDSTYNLQRAIRLFESSSLAKHNSHQTISV